MMKLRAFLLTLAALLMPVAALADDAKLRVVEVKLAPAALVQPALKYQLLPDVLDQTPGNAVPLYLKAMARPSVNQAALDAFNKEQQAWLAGAPAQLPREKVRAALAPFDNVLHQVSMAARRTVCQWDPPVREERNPFEILLPELQEFRTFGRLLAVRIHLAIAEQKHDTALRDLQTGYAMARQVAQMPFLVSALVGAAIAGQMNQELEALVQAPGAPNLYWAIATLPQPIVDFRPGYDLERAAVQLLMPQPSAVGLAELLKAVGSDPLKLLQYALTPALVAETFAGYAEFRDDLFKWLALPYAEARVGIEQAEARLQAAAAAKSPRALLASLLLPAVGKTKFIEARTARQLAALRTIEALRAQLAITGKLPATLADVTALPIPTNPVTGKPFGYRQEKGTAILSADGPEQTDYQLQVK
jgi:hypothetical protein